MSRRVIDQPDVEQFRFVATAFCDLLDRRATLDAPKLLRNLQPLLPALAGAALSLPDVAPGSWENRGDRIPRWKPLYNNLCEQLSPFTDYWEVFDPYRREEPINGSLADDLSDIYLDIVPGLEDWESADAAARRSIVWDWRFGYETHWGHHLIDAMRAIHALLNVHRIESMSDPATEWPPA